MTFCTMRQRAGTNSANLPLPILPVPSPSAQAILDLFR